MVELKNPFLREVLKTLEKNPAAILDLRFRNLAEAQEMLSTVDRLCYQVKDMPLPIVQAISLVGGALLKQHKIEGMSIKELVQMHRDVQWAAESTWTAVMPETGYLMQEGKATN